ncbi:uncharacterized protein LOC128033943 [Gossypium raimondii]|uniref:uncharacterized protein LOC128033943 n=1 Tax=Gossypium raimondii TaxID=29730 RepID=UPI00227B800F|nr:uncharacterized protein LOC128033943 [Gossypium raimondii]
MRGRAPHNPENVSGSHGIIKDSAVRSEARTLARAYTICTREETSVLDVITGTLSIFDTNVIALIDMGSTHSFKCTNLVFSKNLPVESTEFLVKVSNLISQHVLAHKVCKNCPLMTRGYNFLTDLMLLPFNEFDVILGMAQKYVRKICNAYLAYVLDNKLFELKLESVPVVCEYPDVFPEELPGLPLVKEVEFAIELVPRTCNRNITDINNTLHNGSYRIERAESTVARVDK